MTARAPKDCRDMAEVRAEIDRIDNTLVDVIAERFGYVERAWQIKLAQKAAANVPWRNQQVIDKVRARAVEKGVPPDLCEALWRQMIGWFIQYEEEKLRDELEGKSRDLTRSERGPGHDTCRTQGGVADGAAQSGRDLCGVLDG